MTGIRAIAEAEQSDSLRELTSRYGVQTASELITVYYKQNKITLSGYVIERSSTQIKITSKDNQSTTTDLKNAKITPEQRDKLLEEIWNGIRDFFEENWDDIKLEKIKAADIGGAIYGIAATVILKVINPFSAAGSALSKLIALPFLQASVQKGRYWGASVDTIVEIIKGESDLNKEQMAGVLATVIVIAYYLPLPGAIIQLGGVDAWNLTVDVGKKIGGTAADAVDEIKSVVGDVGEAISDAAGKAIDAVLDIF